MEISAALQKAYNIAKIELMTKKNSVFITTILFSLKHKWVTAEEGCSTAAVDGINIVVNPDFLMSLTPGQRITLLAHEAWHIAFSHITRKDHRDHSVWNQAGDYVINWILKNAGYEPLDPITIDGKKTKWLLDSKYEGMSTEQVYDLLIKDPQNQQNPMPDLRYSDGTSSDPDAPKGDKPSPAEQKAIDDHIADILVKAVTQSKMSNDEAGSIPGNIEIELEKMLNPTLPWNIILQRFLNDMAKNDYTFSRPNRRYMPDFYLPSLHSEGLSHVAFAVDSSCSVSDNEFLAMNSEINHVHQSMAPELLTILNFDTQVQDIHKLTESDSVAKIKFHGRGGTNLTPMMNYFKENVPQALIVFSDLECRAIKDDPGFPVIWIAVNSPNAKVNFGQLLHMECSR